VGGVLNTCGLVVRSQSGAQWQKAVADGRGCWWPWGVQAGSIVQKPANGKWSRKKKARTLVLLLPPSARLRSFRTSLASMLMLATSFTTHAIFSFDCSSRWRRTVVLPARFGGGHTGSEEAMAWFSRLLACLHACSHKHVQAPVSAGV